MGSVNMTLFTSSIASCTDDYYVQNVLEENMFGIERPIKHLLGSSWTFWFYKNDRSQSWKQSQRAVMTFSTVEDFWALTHHLMLASELPPGSDMHCSRKVFSQTGKIAGMLLVEDGSLLLIEDRGRCVWTVTGWKYYFYLLERIWVKW